MILELTEREARVIRFALHRFKWQAHNQFDAASQKATAHFFAGLDASRFLQDAQDAEALLARLSSPSQDT